MTTATVTQVSVTPMVKIVLRGREADFPFSQIAREGDDPATISDQDLIERSVQAAIDAGLEVQEGDTAKLVVSRPSSGNILVSAYPEFGG